MLRDSKNIGLTQFLYSEGFGKRLFGSIRLAY